jgi:hypothetical protein
VTRGGVVGVEREGELDWGLSCGNEEQREHDSDSQRLMTQGILVTSYPFFGLVMIGYYTSKHDQNRPQKHATGANARK